MQNKTILSGLTAMVILLTVSCSDANNKGSSGQSGSNATGSSKEESQSTIKTRNEEGELIDPAGNVITGCAGHKEFVGYSGDMCPKCENMVMIPITWDITGIDTVRVTSPHN